MLNNLPIEKHLSAGLIVVHFDGERYRLLTLRTFNDWDFPKTQVNDGDDPMQAALTVTEELTGLTDLELPWGEEHRETLAFEDGDVSRYYIAQSQTDDVELRVPSGDGGLEDYEYRWVTADEAEDVLPPRLGVVLHFAVRQLTSGAGQKR